MIEQTGVGGLCLVDDTYSGVVRYDALRPVSVSSTADIYLFFAHTGGGAFRSAPYISRPSNLRLPRLQYRKWG